MSNITKILVTSNLLLLLVVGYFLLWPKKMVVQASNVDYINQISEAERKSFLELKEKLNEIDQKQIELIKKYHESIDELNKRYDERLTLLEKKKVTSTKKIAETFANDMPGLANALSQETGLEVMKK